MYESKRIECRGGDTSNLLDNLLSRMELYANNLEDLVAARTADYLTQKKRAEGTGALTIRRGNCLTISCTVRHGASPHML